MTESPTAALTVRVRLHGALHEHAGGRHTLDLVLAPGSTLRDLLDALAAEHPALERRVRDETGKVRRHVNLFVDGEPAQALGGVEHRLRGGAEVLVLPAVSGG